MPHGKFDLTNQKHYPDLGSHSLIVKNNLLGVVKNKNNFLDEEDNAGTDWCTCVIVLLRLNRLTDQRYGSLINWEVSSIMR